MFSDIISDSLASILDMVSPDYAYEEVYPRMVVINMIASMLLAQVVSDARGPDGEFFGNRTLQDLRRETLVMAIKLYDDKMSKKN
jgi:hypothetical protein